MSTQKSDPGLSVRPLVRTLLSSEMRGIDQRMKKAWKQDASRHLHKELKQPVWPKPRLV